MGEVNIVQCRLSVGDMQVSVEGFNRLPIGRCIRGMNVPLDLGFRSGPGNLQGHIRCPGNRIVKTRERCGRGDIHVVQIHPCGIGTIFGELSFLQDRIHFEVSAGVSAPQSSAAQSNVVRREL